MTKLLFVFAFLLLRLQEIEEVTATPLTEAVEQKQSVEVLQSILQNESEDIVDTPDEQERTPLMLAIRSSLWETAHFLIEKGANTLLQSRTYSWYRSTPFKELFVWNAPVQLLEYTIDRLPEKPNSIILPGRDNLLHLALAYPNTEAVRLLLEKGVDVTAANDAQRTPLFDAVSSREISLDLLRAMLNSRDRNTISSSLNSGRSVLMKAIEFSDWDAVELLIDFGADVTLKLERVYCPLDLAVEKRVEAELFKKMLRSQERQDIMTFLMSTGLDPLYAALNNRRWDLAHLLIQHGSDVTHSGFSSPLYLAVSNGVSFDFLKEMLESQDRAKITEALNNNHYDLPLNKAVSASTALSGDRWAVVQLLLKYGADATVSYGGRSAINEAVMCHIGLEKVKTLLDSQPRDKVIHALRVDEASLNYAMKSGQFSVASLLLRYGADATVHGYNISIFYSAITSGADIELIRDLLDSHEPNGIAEALNSGPDALVEALKHTRWDVARLLLEFGADPTRKYRHETAQDVAEQLLQTHEGIEETRGFLEAIIHPPGKSKSALKV